MSISLESLYGEIDHASTELEIIERKREFLVRKIQYMQGLADCLKLEDSSSQGHENAQQQPSTRSANHFKSRSKESDKTLDSVTQTEKHSTDAPSEIEDLNVGTRNQPPVILLAAPLPVRIALEFTGSGGEGMTSQEVFRRVQVRDETVKIGTVQGYLSKWKSLGLLKTVPRNGKPGFVYFCTPQLVVWLDQKSKKRKVSLTKEGAFIPKGEPKRHQITTRRG